MSVTCGRWVVFSGYSGFLHQWNWLPRYNWHIVESGVKHHNPEPLFICNTPSVVKLKINYLISLSKVKVTVLTSLLFNAYTYIQIINAHCFQEKEFCFNCPFVISVSAHNPTPNPLRLVVKIDIAESENIDSPSVARGLRYFSTQER